MNSKHPIAVIIMLAALFVPKAHAIDGGLGRSMSGAQIVPYQAVVPPEPGAFFISLAETYYDGDIGGSRTLPFGGKLVANIDASISFTPLTIAYDWAGNYGRWNLMSAVVVPFAYERINADVEISGLGSRRILSKATGIYDLMFRPIDACYHISQTQHISVSLDVWAPTGDYDQSSIANLSLDNWTFIPTVSYTQLFKNNIEFSALWALEYYTKNRHTDYQSGLLSRVEAVGLYRVSPRFGIGLVGSWMQQLNADSGALADRFNGFEGRAFGIGPMITTMVKVNNKPVSINARWVHEFENKNLMEGDLLSVSFGVQF